MSLWRQLTRGVRNVFRRDAADRDIADEVDSYVAAAAASFEAQGMTPQDARLAARRQIGSTTALREEVRSYGWENLVGSIVADLRFGGRRLRANPGFALVTIATLALGIGGATAIFSAVNPVLFASLPYPHPDRVVSIDELYASGRRSG